MKVTTMKYKKKDNEKKINFDNKIQILKKDDDNEILGLKKKIKNLAN